MKQILILLFLISQFVSAQVFYNVNGKYYKLGNNFVKVKVDGDLQYTTTSASTAVSFVISGTANDTLKVDWGDNNISFVKFTGATQTVSHTYSLAGQYNVFFTKKVSSINYFSSTSAYFSGTYNSRHLLWTGLKYYNQTTSTIFKGGNVNFIPADTFIFISDLSTTANKYSINFNLLSKNITYLYLSCTSPSFTGDLDSLNKKLTYLVVYNASTSTNNYGNVHIQDLSTKITTLNLWNIPDSIIWTGYWSNKVLTTLTLQNSARFRYNFIVDSLSTKLTVLSIGGAGISGNFNNWFYKARNIVQITGFSNTSATGQVDTSYKRLTYAIINNNTNFTNNDINNFRNCTYLQFTTNGSTSGATDSLSKCLSQTITGSTTNYAGCTGEITAIPSAATYIYWSGFGSITYNGGTVPSFSSLGTFTLSGNMTETQLRAFLIAWSATATSKNCTCNFAGTNASLHINATDDPDLYNAYTTLQGLNKTIQINTY